VIARRITRQGLLALLIVGAPVLAGASMLHLKLSRSVPSANAVLTASPTEVRLWFTQRPELSVTSIRIRSGTGASAVERVLAPLARAEAANSPITAPVGAALAPGHYEVVWRTMARDGHVLNGVIPFDVRPAR
jgi:methionine-rich copper-binding protein CopC